MFLNEVKFAGFAGRDAEVKQTQSGAEYVRLQLGHTQKAKDSRYADETTWVDVEVYGGWCKTASDIKKGDNVFVAGPLKVRDYDDKETGKKRRFTSILAFQVAPIKQPPREPAPEPAPLPQNSLSTPGGYTAAKPVDEWDAIPF